MSKEQEQKYTPEGLPIVTNDTLRSFAREIIRRGTDTDAQFKKTHNYLNEIAEENPVIEKYMVGTVTTIFMDDFHKTSAFEAMAGLYMLLKNQAIANNVEESLENTEGD